MPFASANSLGKICALIQRLGRLGVRVRDRTGRLLLPLLRCTVKMRVAQE
jgi:hypothetical protein